MEKKLHFTVILGVALQLIGTACGGQLLEDGRYLIDVQQVNLSDSIQCPGELPATLEWDIREEEEQNGLPVWIIREINTGAIRRFTEEDGLLGSFEVLELPGECPGIFEELIILDPQGDKFNATVTIKIDLICEPACRGQAILNGEKT